MDLIEGDDTVLRNIRWRRRPEGQLNAYRHNGFWQCMDTMREKENWRSCGRAARLHGKCGNNDRFGFYKGKKVLVTGIPASREAGW